MPKFSIAIKINSDEQNIRNCLDSIVNQTFKDIEILCMHDFSSNDIPTQVVQEYKKADERIILVNVKDKQLSAAKNMILNVIKGEYCYFIDSDSTIVYPKLFEYAKTIFDNFDIDYFCFGAEENKSHNGEDAMYHDGYSELTFDLRFFAGTFLGNKILKTKIIKDNNIQFPEEGLHENTYFMWCYQFASKSVYFDDGIFNYYVKNNNQNEKQSFNNAVYQMYNWRKLLDYLKNRDKLQDNYDNMIYLLDFYSAVSKRVVQQEDKYKIEKLKLTYLNELLELKGKQIPKSGNKSNEQSLLEMNSNKDTPKNLISSQMYSNITNPELENEKTVSLAELMSDSSKEDSNKDAVTFYDHENEIEVEMQDFNKEHVDYLPNVEDISDMVEKNDKQGQTSSTILSFMGIKIKHK